MTDYWNLRDLFDFNGENLRVFNDTNSEVEYTDSNHQKHKIPINGTLKITERNDDFKIPNFDTIKFSNKVKHEKTDFYENLRIITRWYKKQLKDGQIKKGIEFLEYHYSRTKFKKDFIFFVKYYFLSQYWLPIEKREKDWLIEEWIKSKVVKLERPKYLWIIGLILVILVLGTIFLSEYREILFGAMLGMILARTDKLIDKITEKK